VTAICTNDGATCVHEMQRSGAEEWWVDRCPRCGTVFNAAVVPTVPTPVKVVT
jgi:uncharacterized Zn finger protein